MAAVREFTLPDLGEGLTEATVVRWLVAVGDVVQVDQPVVEVETAKALVDVPCPYGGVVTARYGEEGTELPVGAPLVTVAVGAAAEPADDGGGADGADEAEGGGATSPAAVEGKGASGESPDSGGSGNVLVGYGTAAGSTRRRRTRLADAWERPLNGSAGAGSAGGATGTTGAGERNAGSVIPVISPLVRRLAREHDVDLHTVRGSGPDGLILRADVEQAAARTAAPDATAPGSPGSAGSAHQGAERVPLTGLRGAVADKLSRSRREIPEATCWVDADATELLSARRAMNAHGDAQGAPRLSLMAVLARIATAALARFPELNATVDTERREIVRLPEVHLGFAAQTERGLMVPVVRDAHAMDAVRLGEEMARLTESARTGTLTPRELTGGTFTLNNYGVFGVDGSTPIINHPEAAMLGVGRIAEKPWAVDGELAVRRVVQLSLTFDHRVCDGGTAGGFLRYVADCVEQPAVLLRTL